MKWINEKVGGRSLASKKPRHGARELSVLGLPPESSRGAVPGGSRFLALGQLAKIQYESFSGWNYESYFPTIF